MKTMIDILNETKNEMAQVEGLNELLITEGWERVQSGPEDDEVEYVREVICKRCGGTAVEFMNEEGWVYGICESCNRNWGL